MGSEGYGVCLFVVVPGQWSFHLSNEPFHLDFVHSPELTPSTSAIFCLLILDNSLPNKQFLTIITTTTIPALTRQHGRNRDE